MDPSSSTEAELETRIRQQEVVADIGQQALETDELDELLHDATAIISETLNTEYSHVLELLPDTSEFVLRQGVGWQSGVVGSATVPTERESQAGYTLLSKEPVIVDDLGSEDRFCGNDLLVDHDVVSGITVLIGSVDDPWGILGTFTTGHRSFTDHDATFVRSIANVLASAIVRTERERDLQRKERRYEAIFEDPNILVGLLEPDGTVLYINGTAMEYIDADLEAVTGEPFWETPWWGESDGIQPDIREWVERAAAGEYVDFEADLTRPDGGRYTLSGVFRPVTDDDGEVVSIIVSDRDITEQKERERELEESEQRYRALVEHFPNGSVGLFDEDLEYTAVGGQLLDTLDVDPEDRIGRSIRELHPDGLLEEIEPYFQAALGGETNSFEHEFRGRHLSAHTLPVRDADDDVFAGMLVVQDVTERRKYERKLEESNERLKQFAYAASHDLQEPLRMVTSYLQLLENRYGDAFDDEGEEFLAFAVDGAERMREMIDGLLEYSRVDTRGDPFEVVDLDAVLADVRRDLQVKIEETDTEIVAEDLPRVYGDGSQLNQVFQNLLSNAIEYSGGGPPRIHVTAERADDGDEWVISVRDEGIGIAPEDADRVFEVFQSLQGHDDAGAGIGLALVERIVERHGGDIWIDSEPGEGATFSFTLPAADDRE